MNQAETMLAFFGGAAGLGRPHVSKHRQGVKAKRPAHLKPIVRMAVVDGGRIEIRDRVRVRNGNVITL